jgi:hypothetical protein
MRQLTHHAPVTIQIKAGAHIFVEQQMTAEFRAMVSGIQISIVNHTAEAGLSEKAVRVGDRPGETTIELIGGGMGRGKRRSEMQPWMQQLRLPVIGGVLAKRIEKDLNIGEHAVFPIMAALD